MENMIRLWIILLGGRGLNKFMWSSGSHRREEKIKRHPGKYWTYKLHGGTTLRVEFHCYDSSPGELPSLTHIVFYFFRGYFPGSAHTRERERKRFGKANSHYIACVRGRRKQRVSKKSVFALAGCGDGGACSLEFCGGRLCTKNNLHGFLARPITRGGAHRRPFSAPRDRIRIRTESC